MSIDTWLEEFYPIPAPELPSWIEPITSWGAQFEALNHCIQKWTGFLPENLKKHNVKYFDGVRPAIGSTVRSCALCQLNNLLDGCNSCLINKTNICSHLVSRAHMNTPHATKPLVDALIAVKQRFAAAKSPNDFETIRLQKVVFDSVAAPSP